MRECQAITSNWSSARVGEFFEEQAAKVIVTYQVFAKNYTDSTFALCKVRKFSTFEKALSKIEDDVGGKLKELIPVVLSHPTNIQTNLKVRLYIYYSV